MENELSQLTPQQRLEVYNLILKGCSHLWSKGHIQDGSSYVVNGKTIQTEDKVRPALRILIPLIKDDPYFLAHLTSYAMRKTQNKDLQVLTTFVNSLSTANGTPFSPGSKYLKPNLRIISAAAVQKFDPKLAERLLEMSQDLKFGVDNYLNEATHLSTFLRTSFKKYLKYREENPSMLKGAYDAGLADVVRRMYRLLRIVPDDEIAKMIHYKKKGLSGYNTGIDFTGKTDLEVAEMIREKKLPAMGVIMKMDRTITPVIAVALLEQCTGNLAVILRRTFDEAGVLKDPEVMKLYEEKIATAQNTLDRAKTLSEDASEAVKQALNRAKSAKRKSDVGDFGKIFLHIDISYSMQPAIEVAKQRGAIIAETVQDPTNNFKWGLFNNNGYLLEIPEEFVEDAFAAKLFGARAEGGTDAFIMYPEARRFGAEIDVFISDGGHNAGATNLAFEIDRFHSNHPEIPKPKAMVLVHVRGTDFSDELKRGYEAAGIPVAVLDPNTLTESALVSEAIRTAMLGPVAVVDEIMNTELLELPEWYYTI